METNLINKKENKLKRLLKFIINHKTVSLTVLMIVPMVIKIFKKNKQNHQVNN